MLTIEKEPTLVQKYGVLVGAFAIGLITSLGALYTIDPKSNATVVQTSEPTHKKEADDEAATAASTSARHTDTSDSTTALVRSRPADRAVDRSEQAENPTKTKPQNASTKEAGESTNEVSSARTDGLFSLPIVELLFLRDEDQDK